MTYVPEIGTIASPLAGTPSVTEVKSATKDETDLKAINQDLNVSGHLSESPKGNPVDNVLGCSSDNSSPKHTDIWKLNENHELSDGTTDKCRVNKSISPCHPARSEAIALKKKVSKSPALAETSIQSDASDKECEKHESECVQKLNADSLKRNKSVSPIHWSVKKVSTDERNEASNNCGQKESNTEETLNVDEVQYETTKEPESKATSKSSAIYTNNNGSSKTSTIHCDMNHNSKSAKSSNMDSLQSKCTLKPVQSESMKRLDHLRKDTPNSVDEKDLSKKSNKDHTDKHIKAGETIKPDRDSESKKTEKSDSNKASCKNEKVLKSKDVDKGPTKEKKDHGLTTGKVIYHTSKCRRRFGGIYAYCRYFIDRKW